MFTIKREIFFVYFFTNSCLITTMTTSTTTLLSSNFLRDDDFSSPSITFSISFMCQAFIRFKCCYCLSYYFPLTLGTKRGLFHFDIIISISRYDDLFYNILIVTYRHTIIHSKTILGYQKL